jgi:hypothetical protein
MVLLQQHDLLLPVVNIPRDQRGSCLPANATKKIDETLHNFRCLVQVVRLRR